MPGPPQPSSPLIVGDDADLRIRLALITCCLIKLMNETGRRVVEIDDYRTIDDEQTVGFEWELPSCRFYITKD